MDVVSLALEGKLYARKGAVKQLKEAYRQRKKELVLLIGEAGSGKSALAQTLRRTVRKDGGVFISGKYDEHRTDNKVTAGLSCPVALALTELMEFVQQNDELLTTVRAVVSREIAAEGHLLVDMIPALSSIIESSVSSENEGVLKGQTFEQVRTAKAGREGFELVFGKLVRSIGNVIAAQHRIVLFVDDLQWSDTHSLSLLHLLLRNKGENWFVFGAVRDNEVSANGDLCEMLRELEDQEKTTITQIEVGSLGEQGVKEAVNDFLLQPKEDCQSLISIVHEQTGGNPLFLRQYLQYLCEGGLLFVNRECNQWRWKQEKIQAKNKFKNVGDMLEAKMKKVEPKLQHLLAVAACLGSDFTVTLVVAAEAGDSLLINKAVEKGFFYKNGESLRWQHDKMRQAAFGVVGSCEELYLSTGWKLYRNLSASQLEENLFVVLGHFSRGARLLVDQEDKNVVARLCLRAGEKAVLSSNFTSATACFALGLSSLSARCWRDDYELTLALHNCAAEAEYCVGNFEGMDGLLDSVLQNARTFHDKLRASTLQIFALGSRNRHAEAVNLGLQALEKLGERFPRTLLMPVTGISIMRTTYALRNRSDDNLLSLPILVDPDKLAAMRILSILMMSALIAKPDVAALLIIRLMQMTLRHGLCAVSTLAFASFGMLKLRLGNHQEAFRYGQLSLIALEKFKATEYLPRVYCAVYAGFNTWKFPFRSGLKHLAFAHQVGLETGDIESAMFNSMLYTLLSFCAGRSLEQLLVETQQATQLMKQYGQDTAYKFTDMMLQVFVNFTGRSKDPLVIEIDDLEREVDVKRVGRWAHNYYMTPLAMNKLVLSFYFNEYELANKYSREIRKNKYFDSGSIVYRLNSFYQAMTAMALAHHSRDPRQIFLARRLLRVLKKCEVLVPENCQNKVILIEAELAAYKGNMELALTKFARSIEKAGEEGILPEQALASERAGVALRRCSDFAGAAPFLRRAQLIYQEWGAHAKVTQMNNMYALDVICNVNVVERVQSQTTISTELSPLHQPRLPPRGYAQ